MDSVSVVWYIVIPICLFLSIIGCCCCKLQESKRRRVNRHHRSRRLAMRRPTSSSPTTGTSNVFVIDDSGSHSQIELPPYTPYRANDFSPPPYNVDDLPPTYDPPTYEESLHHLPVGPNQDNTTC